MEINNDIDKNEVENVNTEIISNQIENDSIVQNAFSIIQQLHQNQQPIVSNQNVLINGTIGIGL